MRWHERTGRKRPWVKSARLLGVLLLPLLAYPVFAISGTGSAPKVPVSSTTTSRAVTPPTIGAVSPPTTTAPSTSPAGGSQQSGNSGTASPAPSLTDDVYAAWSRVAVCEEGGWIGYAGPSYPDSLGISAAAWSTYGGGSDESPADQIRVAQAIEAAAGTPGYVPDQSGFCASW